MPKGNKIDIVFMNPPYQRGLSNKFLEKALDITASHLVTVQPDSYMFKGKSGIVTIKDILKDKHIIIENINPNAVFDAGFQNRVAILDVDFNNEKRCVYNGIEFNDIYDIKFFSDDRLISDFYSHVSNYIEEHNMYRYLKGVPGIHNDPFTEYNPDPDWHVCPVTLIRGHISSTGTGYSDDFYTYVSKNDVFSIQRVGKYKDIIKIKDRQRETSSLQYYMVFDNRQAALNYINFLKGDFARACLYCYKKDVHINIHCIPEFDFSDEVFNKSPKEIDDMLFERFKISDEIRKHIEKILPDYYNIR